MSVIVSLTFVVRDDMGLVATKPVFGVADKARIKPVCSPTETSKRIAISLVASIDVIVFKKRITKALISLRGCTSRSAPLFSLVEAHTIILKYNATCV